MRANEQGVCVRTARVRTNYRGCRCGGTSRVGANERPASGAYEQPSGVVRMNERGSAYERAGVRACERAGCVRTNGQGAYERPGVQVRRNKQGGCERTTGGGAYEQAGVVRTNDRGVVCMNGRGFVRTNKRGWCIRTSRVGAYE